MSFGVSAGNGAFEWGIYSVSSFVDKLSRLVSPWFWRFVFDIMRLISFHETIFMIPRFSSEITKHLPGRNKDAFKDGQEFIGVYVTRNRYSSQFTNYFLIPMAAALWCIDPDEFAWTFPAKSLIEFM
jgi:predicted NAD/FAD-binding protein